RGAPSGPPAAATGSPSSSATTVGAGRIRPTAPASPGCTTGWPPSTGGCKWSAPSVDPPPCSWRSRAREGVVVRIVIAEDSVLLRAGLTRLLTEEGEEIVAA